MKRFPSRFLLAALTAGLVGSLAACGSSSTAADDAVGADVPGDGLPADVPPDGTVADVRPDLPADTPDTAPDVAPDVADVPADTGTDVALPPLLTPQQIGYVSVEAPWTGSVIYFNTWSRDGVEPDRIRMMRPDGSQAATRIEAKGIWAFGVAPDGTIAFSSNDPFQGVNYPDIANLGSAIQYTFLVRPGEDPVQLSNGRVNDECHVFLPDGQTLLLCRRANFAWDGENYVNDPYRLARVDLQTGTSTFLTAILDGVNDLNAYPRQDGRLLYVRQAFEGTEISDSLRSMNPDGTDDQEVLPDGFGLSVSQDGETAWFRVVGNPGWWKAQANNPGAGAVVQLKGGDVPSGVTPSPDGSMVVYEVADTPNQCTDLWVRNADGSGEPVPLIDCDPDHDDVFIANVRWVQTDSVVLPDRSPEPAPDASEEIPDAAGDPATETAGDVAPDPGPADLPPMPDARDAGSDD